MKNINIYLDVNNISFIFKVDLFLQNEILKKKGK